MRSRLFTSLTAVSAALCVAVLVAFTLDGVFNLRFNRVVWNSDGSSTGYYLMRDLSLLIRRRGFGPEFDYDRILDVGYYFLLFGILPLIWLRAHRPIHALDRRRRGFALLCASCPLVLTMCVIYVRRNEAEVKFAVAGIVVPFVLVGIMRIYVVYHLRRSQNRLAKGLCPMCGYDLRATPHRCPECGASIHPTPVSP